MTTVTDADREAAADYFGMTNDALRADFARSGKYDLSVCVQAFARHREAEVAKIVALAETLAGALATAASCLNQCAEGLATQNDMETWAEDATQTLRQYKEARDV